MATTLEKPERWTRWPLGLLVAAPETIRFEALVADPRGANRPLSHGLPDKVDLYVGLRVRAELDGGCPTC